MAEPRWLTNARKYLGQREIPGAQTAPVIAGWLQKLGAWWRDDETPWCGTFVAAVMNDSNLPRAKHWYRAQGWLEWGVPLLGPTLGAIVVFKRSGGGHVGIIAGIDEHGNLMVLGGNQGNAVCIMPFARDRVIGYRWPAAMPVPVLSTLPVLASTGALSRNEA